MRAPWVAVGDTRCDRFAAAPIAARGSWSGEERVRTFSTRISVASAIARRVRQRIGLWLLRNSLPMFVRANDSISLDPLVNGSWEPVLAEFLKNVAHAGYDGFLLDIGANIGLTSCQCGDCFREVCMFEPNPEIFPILELNAKLMLRSCRTRAFNVGLGPVSMKSTLNIPTHNWGGAFIHDRFNAYPDSLIAARHLVKQFDVTAYRQVEVQIEEVGRRCPYLFAEFSHAGLKRGVIKLDTEGYEKAILESLAGHIPGDFQVVVVFENWDPDFAIEKLMARFDRPVGAFLIDRRPRQRGALWRDLPFMIRLGGMSFTLEPIEGRPCEGDVVLVVGARD
jgi:FkbM family methyltransferase